MIKSFLALTMILSFTLPALAVEVVPGQSVDPKEAQVDQKKKQTTIEQSFEQRRAALKKKHKEKLAAKKEPKVEKTQKAEDPAVKENKEIIQEIQKDVQDQKVRDDRQH
jgi:hypothetical protein